MVMITGSGSGAKKAGAPEGDGGEHEGDEAAGDARGEQTGVTGAQGKDADPFLPRR